MKRQRRGFLLIMALFVAVLLFIECGSMLYRRSRQYQMATDGVYGAEALSLAEAGLEDARVKLDKDADFPPQAAIDQQVFSYVERVMDLDGTTLVGSYEVTIDQRQQSSPCQIIRITSVGCLGDASAPRARRQVTVELDVARKLRSNPNTDNPNYFRFITREGP